MGLQATRYGQQAIARARASLELLLAPRRSQTLRDLIEQVWFALGGPGALDDDYAIENVYRYLDVLGGLERAGSLLDVGELESVLDLEMIDPVIVYIVDDDLTPNLFLFYRSVVSTIKVNDRPSINGIVRW